MANWTDLSSAFGYGTKLTSQQMQQLRDNITALAEGASGAPDIEEAAYGAASVNQTALKTSTGNSGGSLAAGNSQNISMGAYCFFPNYYTDNLTMLTVGYSSDDSTQVGRFRIYNSDGVSHNYDVDWRYVTATGKPFIFALFDKLTGLCRHVWMCDDDPPPGWPGQDPIVEIDAHGRSTGHLRTWQEKAPAGFLREIKKKALIDRKYRFEILSEYFEYDADKKLFKSKNLLTI